ncbi:GNAT family N-acetyltransferase [Reichenbachiella agarivorans]|uniref:GNAT family N-acetyltransferase n=1 Tax=Reichenbachiella agarivorans TaxID=2979464 RepID=A0ABY6CU16_9BACT|nr:GNAT family N-acetyltransferase [Reichenbachiella agarivorans]UXP31740.1 GNAT family N-acetyltransferase [Reichenbachiella agarivorans]
MTTEFTIRKGQLDDLVELQKLFLETITEICKADYNEDQIDAWISDTKNNEDRQRWINILVKQFVLVAHIRNEIVGFITLDNGNYVDLLYVHKNHQRKGIADSLYEKIENEARRQNQSFLTSNVSKTARPFFEKVGFKVTKEQTVVRQSVKLTNYKMEKKINPNR